MVLPHPSLWFGGGSHRSDDGLHLTGGASGAPKQTSATEEAALVQAVQGDDPDALTTLYRAYFERLRRYAYQILRDDDTAQSLVQDVFVSVWERRAVWQLTGSLESYLYRAVRNRAWKAARDDKIRTRLRSRAVAESGHSPGMASAQPDAVAQMERQELDALIARALAALPERQHEALALRWSHQLRYADIARVMDVSEARVRQLVTRAEEQVREAVTSYLGDG